MDIKRIPGPYQGRVRAVNHGGLVYAVATARSDSPSVAEQTRLTLENLEQNLADGGSDRTRILQATIYLRDMATKDEMDAVWCDWIGDAGNWPQRACVGTDLAGNDMVEIVVVAAARE
ncbi:MAG: RidA family protein [Hyphomicrobiales bacterium]|nr:RidA family protein [Hyphomicrobiales bacterium]MCP5371273.1 RidA family protein [Hyphomicrobiales bacterium]